MTVREAPGSVGDGVQMRAGGKPNYLSELGYLDRGVARDCRRWAARPLVC